MRPTVRQLEYAVAVADHLSFHRAADACHVTQPGLSAQLRQLESLLDVRLFERDRRAVIATAAGEALIPRARAILTAVDELRETAKGFTKPLTGTVRLGVIPTVAPYLLPGVLPGVRRRYPDLRLLIREAQTGDLVRWLHEGRLDVLVLALEADLGAIEAFSLFEDPFVVAMPSDHALGAKAALTEDDLAGQQVLLLEDGHCLRDQALSVCETAGATELGDFRATSLGTLAQMVANGIGLTLLPSIAVPVEVERRGPLVCRPFRRPVPHRTIALVWRQTSPRGDEFRLLGEALRAGGPPVRRAAPARARRRR